MAQPLPTGIGRPLPPNPTQNTPDSPPPLPPRNNLLLRGKAVSMINKAVDAHQKKQDETRFVAYTVGTLVGIAALAATVAFFVFFTPLALAGTTIALAAIGLTIPSTILAVALPPTACALATVIAGCFAGAMAYLIGRKKDGAIEQMKNLKDNLIPQGTTKEDLLSPTEMKNILDQTAVWPELKDKLCRKQNERYLEYQKRKTYEAAPTT